MSVIMRRLSCAWNHVRIAQRGRLVVGGRLVVSGLWFVPKPQTTNHQPTTASVRRARSSQVLVEEIDRALPRQLGRRLVVARRGVVVEAVVRAGVDVLLVLLVV